MKGVVLFISLVFIQLNAISQERNWKIEKTKDGLVTVKSEVVDGQNKSGEEIKIMHYVAERTGKLTLAQAEKFLSNSDNYKQIWESTLETHEIRKISDDEWISYFLYAAFWPMPKSDCVQHYKITKREPNKLVIQAKAVDEGEIIPDVKRLSLFDILFEFEKINENEVQLTLSVQTSPAINAPKFLFRSWFPKGPAGIVNRIFEKAGKE